VNHYKFTGYERDGESGNDYAMARYFSSQYGRFMTPDPAGLLVADASDPQSWNEYTYVEDDPEDMTDPSGLEGGNNGYCDNNPSDPICRRNPPDCPAGASCGPTGEPRTPPKVATGPAKQPPKCPSSRAQTVYAAMMASDLPLAAALAEAYVLAQLTGNAVVVGAGGSGAFGLWEGLGVSGGATVGFAVDPAGNVGLAFSGRLGGGFKGTGGRGYAAGGVITFSRSATIFSLQGTSPQGSVSRGVAGLGGTLAVTPTGSITITTGAASGAFGTFGGVGGTKIVPLVCRKQ